MSAFVPGGAGGAISPAPVFAARDRAVAEFSAQVEARLREARNVLGRRPRPRAGGVFVTRLRSDVARGTDVPDALVVRARSYLVAGKSRADLEALAGAIARETGESGTLYVLRLNHRWQG